MIALVGCKKVDSFARVTVSSTSSLAAVARLHATANIAGASSAFDIRGDGDSGATFAIPPSRTFGVIVPAVYAGTFMLHIDAFDDADNLLASGDGQVDIAAGQSRDVEVVLGGGAVDMAGGPDLSLSGPMLEMTPPSFVFPLTNEGMNGSTTTFTVKNIGEQTTAILPAPLLQGASPASFYVASTDCQGVQLAPGAFCSVTVQYKPVAAGKISAVVAVGAAMSSIDAISLGVWRVDMAPVFPDLAFIGDGGNSGPPTHFLTVWGADAVTVFLGSSEGGIFQRVNNAWMDKQYVGSATAINAIWGSSATNIYAVGSTTTLWHYDGATWSDFHGNITATAHPNFYAAGGTGANNVLVGGDGNLGLTQSSGTATWTDDPLSPAPISALWADPASGDLFAIDGTAIQRRQGSTWTLSHTSTLPLRAIWGASASDVFAVGDGGTILHYDGTSWQAPLQPPPTVAYHGVWGTAGDDVFVVGDSGTILHSAGNNVWGTQASNTAQTLNSVWGSATGDVYVVGNYMLVLHYN